MEDASSGNTADNAVALELDDIDTIGEEVAGGSAVVQSDGSFDRCEGTAAAAAVEAYMGRHDVSVQNIEVSLAGRGGLLVLGGSS